MVNIPGEVGDLGSIWSLLVDVLLVVHMVNHLDCFLTMLFRLLTVVLFNIEKNKSLVSTPRVYT